MSDADRLDQLSKAKHAAMGRVVTRIETYDAALDDDGRALALEELLKRCRDLKSAIDAHRNFLLAPGSGVRR